MTANTAMAVLAMSCSDQRVKQGERGIHSLSSWFKALSYNLPAPAFLASLFLQREMMSGLRTDLIKLELTTLAFPPRLCVLWEDAEDAEEGWGIGWRRDDLIVYK